MEQSSEIRGLCLMKCSCEMLQNLPYFWNMKIYVVFFRFSLCAILFFSLINALVYVDIFQAFIKVKIDRMKKKTTCAFIFQKYGKF